MSGKKKRKVFYTVFGSGLDHIFECRTFSMAKKRFAQSRKGAVMQRFWRNNGKRYVKEWIKG